MKIREAVRTVGIDIRYSAMNEPRGSSMNDPRGSGNAQLTMPQDVVNANGPVVAASATIDGVAAPPRIEGHSIEEEEAQIMNRLQDWMVDQDNLVDQDLTRWHKVPKLRNRA
eukprot:gnl/TRDRNA2_/TRDRNA2_140662_c4_seq1.p2 gnl/TRDRNA2_/TRDRNA2_140662_c4~~gnl/TRDRNA2_/TRDRNA2_140662_c4_seq1.p2  ORF type:complete len:112 (-),score=17.31 gnl/TRDRNA2_/TRDRNA2_140662_c4_seq1:80-415(-)